MYTVNDDQNSSFIECSSVRNELPTNIVTTTKTMTTMINCDSTKCELKSAPPTSNFDDHFQSYISNDDVNIQHQTQDKMRKMNKTPITTIINTNVPLKFNSERDSTDIMLRKNSLSSGIDLMESFPICSSIIQSSSIISRVSSIITSVNSLKSLYAQQSCKTPQQYRRHLNLVPLLLFLLFTIPAIMSAQISSNTPNTTPPSPVAPSHIDQTQMLSKLEQQKQNQHNNDPNHPKHSTLQSNVIHERLNPIELKLLNQLMDHQVDHRMFHHNRPENEMSDHIFDPTSEEISIDLKESSGHATSAGKRRNIQVPIEGMYVSHKRSKNFEHAKKLDLSASDEMEFKERKTFDGINDHKTNNLNHYSSSHRYPESFRLTPHEAHALVQKVINNGIIDATDFKTLEYLAQKYTLGIESEDGADVEDEEEEEANDDLNPLPIKPNLGNDESLSAEQELLAINRIKPLSNERIIPVEQLLPVADPSHNHVITTANEGKMGETQPKTTKSGIVNEDLLKGYQNLEQVLEILMHTENTLKKRGEGPQLSIDSPLVVLRERLLMELARRRAKATQEQIAINSEILKKIGRRRRRRSVSEQDQMEPKSTTKDESDRNERQIKSSVDCDEERCNLHDLNTKWSNIRESMYGMLSNDHNVLNVNSNYPPIATSHHSYHSGRPFHHETVGIVGGIGGAISGINQRKQQFKYNQRLRNNDKYIVFNNDDNDNDESEESTNDERKRLHLSPFLSKQQYNSILNGGDFGPEVNKLDQPESEFEFEQFEKNPLMTYIKMGTSLTNIEPIEKFGNIAPMERGRINSKKPIFTLDERSSYDGNDIHHSQQSEQPMLFDKYDFDDHHQQQQQQQQKRRHPKLPLTFTGERFKSRSGWFQTNQRDKRNSKTDSLIMK